MAPDASPVETVQLLVLGRRDAAVNMARFYVLSLEDTLFGDATLARERGRPGARGCRRSDLFEQRAKAREALQSWLSRKIRRGYALGGRSAAESAAAAPAAFEESRAIRRDLA